LRLYIDTSIWYSDPRAAELAASRRISRQPRKKFDLAAGKIAASRRKNIRLMLALPRDVNENLAITVQSSYNHAVKLQCYSKIG